MQDQSDPADVGSLSSMQCDARKVSGTNDIVLEGSKAEAEQALRKFIAEIETGFASNGDGLTLAGYMNRWLDHASTRVRPRSLSSYRQLTDLHIVPYLGQLRLTDIRPMHVQTLYSTLLKEGRRTKIGGALSANSVLHVHRILFAAFRQAVRWRLIPINVTEAIEPPRVSRFRNAYP